MADKELYFIALIPPSHIYDKIVEWKEYMATNYLTRKALNSPPHITLQMPFKWREDREDRILSVLEKAERGSVPFEINLNGFGFFEPRVVYIDVESSEELAELQKTVGREVRHQLKLVNTLGERPFRPHMTIAFRDLKKPMFYKAKEEFENKSFKERFMADSICLLKHNGRHWEEFYSQPIRS